MRIALRQKRAKIAVQAFKYLGPYAASAVPDLERLAANPAFPGRARRAAEALSYLGPRGRDALARMSISQGLPADSFADAESYLRVMLIQLENAARYSNSVVRRRALRSLALADSSGAVILSALLFDPNQAVRSDATNAVREFFPGLLRQGQPFAAALRFDVP